ncbi:MULTISPECIES: hypothetical protein [Streptomyces]|uniref:Uncharacterized protein n=2 Tax=Streptomyces TaxID=1883 RepID=A0A3R7F9E4_9ACTN|nr:MULTISPECIES: hypothetical protein [Streptomyces]KNE80458.1 hypothetical protein ADZ36_22040 [Streptomyces fradiae]OFA46011.1 hypothetical protein BEN35_21765 [Streptomyces fradiae]PQM21849.1 hypothetical protein Sfr7A_19690 [Streptomyces xinghaiensis]RKM93281.1 hypothetical protein SFRA_022575 [Streptomyces xinghaiensis]RNC71121.1 hypothetical protein DC095_022815 [Streptomyces xinghaiensis]
MTDVELEISLTGDDADLLALIEKTLADDDRTTVVRSRTIRSNELLTIIEVAGTVIGLTDGLLGLRERVQAFLAGRRAAPDPGPAVIEVANTEGEPVPLLEATDDQIRSVVSNPAPPDDDPTTAPESTVPES